MSAGVSLIIIAALIIAQVTRGQALQRLWILS